MAQRKRIRYEYEMLKVEDADAIIIRQYIYGIPYVILIDAGHEENAKQIREHLKKYYRSSHIDLAICTHPDNDHKGGFFGLLNDEDIQIDRLWLSDPDEILTRDEKRELGNEKEVEVAIRKIWQKSEDDRLNLIKLAKEKGIRVRNVIDKTSYDYLHIRIVGPTEDYYKKSIKDIIRGMVNDNSSEIHLVEESDDELNLDDIDNEVDLDFYREEFELDEDESYLDEDDLEKVELEEDDLEEDELEENDFDSSLSNATSLIVLFEPEDGKKLLFTGDANTESLQLMLDEYKDLRNVDLLKVPHHGSRNNLNKDIIDELSPQKSYISASGSKDHPDNGVANYLAKYGNVYSTHKCNSFIYSRSAEMQEREGTKNIAPFKKKVTIKDK
jgi:beta-lactamase superfamily II metal-dependent hydrolase